MMIYKLDNEGFMKERKTFFISCVFTAIIFFFIIRGISMVELQIEGEKIKTLIPVFFAAGIIFFIAIFKTYKAKKEKWTSFQLELSEDGIEVKQNNIKKIYIQYSEIDSINEIINKGIYIYKSTSKDFIFIPIALDGYNDVKEYLQKIREITFNSKKQPSQMTQMTLNFTIVVLFGIAFFSQIPWVVLPVCVVLIAIFIWASIQIIIDSNIKKKLKARFLLVILISILFLALKMFFIIKKII